MPAAASAERLCRLLRGLAPDAQVLLATPAGGDPHLDKSISTGTTCCYQPTEATRWQL